MKLLPVSVLAILCASIAPALDRKPKVKFPKWNELKVSTVKVQRGKLILGLADGGAGIYDLATQTPINVIRGDGKGRTKDITWEGNQLWWIDSTTGKLLSATATQRVGTAVNLVGSGMKQAPKRLTLWQGKVLVQGDSEIRVIDPLTKKVQTPEEFMPKDIARQVAQGTVISNWHSTRDGQGEGQLVVIRRYGKRENPSDKKADIAMFTAWTSTGRNYNPLGTYTRSLVDFTDAPGPRVQQRVGIKNIDQPFGACDPSNLAIGPEGILALDSNELLAIPFRQKSWLPNEIKLRVSPKYNPTLTYSGGNVWWTNGERLFCASIENGATDVYLPKRTLNQPIKALASDENGLWMIQGDWLKRINAVDEGPNGFEGYVRYAAGTEKNDLSPVEQKLRDEALKGEKTPYDPWAYIGHTLRVAGWDGKTDLREFDLKATARTVKGELQIGDIVVRNGQPSLFVGDGDVVQIVRDTPVKKELSVTDGAVIYRVLDRVRLAAAFQAGHKPLADVDPVFRPTVGSGQPGMLAFRAPEVGVGKPVSSLGTDLFVALNFGSKYDKPYLPIHQQLLAEAESWIGTPYVWGGNEKTLGCDCSGFVKGCFQNLGVQLPRFSQDIGQVAIGEVVTDELRFGDVLVISSPQNHVVLYVGGGKTIEAVRGGVGYSSISRRSRAVVRRFFTQ